MAVSIDPAKTLAEWENRLLGRDPGDDIRELFLAEVDEGLVEAFGEEPTMVLDTDGDWWFWIPAVRSWILGSQSEFPELTVTVAGDRASYDDTTIDDGVEYIRRTYGIDGRESVATTFDAEDPVSVARYLLSTGSIQRRD